MHRLVLLALLASACDQGATAATPPPPNQGRALEQIASPPPPPPAPRYVVRDNADFAAKAIVVLEELGAIFADGSTDCELVATRVETYGAQNVTRFSVLMDYGRAHPEAEKELQRQFEPQTQKLIQKMMPVVQACSSNQRLMGAFQKLADQQQMQRPR